MHGFDTSIATIYGGAVEILPVLRIGWEMAFEATVWLGAHVMAVPALGLSEAVTRSMLRRQVVEFGLI